MKTCVVEGCGKVGKLKRGMCMKHYFFTVDTVLKHRLLFSKVYLLQNLFAGSRRFKDMTKEQVAELIEFCDRFAGGQDTRNDWQRIVNNQERLYGSPPQLDMVQHLLLSGGQS